MERWNGLLEWITGMEYWNTVFGTHAYNVLFLVLPVLKAASINTSGSASNFIDLTIDDVLDLHQEYKVVLSPVKVIPGQRFR